MTRKPLSHKQQGFVLILVLVLLPIVLLLGVTSMNSVTLNERTSSNYSDKDRAFHAADTALNVVERWMELNTAPFSPFQPGAFSANGGLGGFTGLYSVSTTIDNAIRSGRVGTINATFGVGPSAFRPEPIGQVSAQPVFIIELEEAPCVVAGSNRTLFKVTARGYGLKPTTQVTLETRMSMDYPCSNLDGSGSDLAPAV